MAKADQNAAAVELPEVKIEKTADEDKFDCPQPWYLVLMTVAMSAMTSVTVAGSLFFLLAAPEKVSAQCYEHDRRLVRGLCTFSAVAFWTYPVVCCLFVALVYAKNLVDQRVYYEFLLHKLMVCYGTTPAYKNKVVIALSVYCLVAFSALVWHHFSTGCADVQVGAAPCESALSHAYSYLAYVTPIISFLAVIFTQWSISGKLITLPNFLEDYAWGVKHLESSRSYPKKILHAAYLRVEGKLEETTLSLETPHMVALIEHYAKEVQASRADGKSDKERTVSDEALESGQGSNRSRIDLGHPEIASAVIAVDTRIVYWEVRLLFNPHLQDERSKQFRKWAIVFMVATILAILLSVYLFACTLVTCLEIEQVLHVGHPAWPYTHRISLRPDLQDVDHDESGAHNLAARFAMSAFQASAGAYFTRARGLLHVHLGAAA